MACLLVVSIQAQQVSSTPGEFIVLRTDRISVPSGQSTHLNCSITGSGDAAQISCESHTSPNGVALIVYHVALVVGSNQVGYVVSCGGGLVWRIKCHPLATGQVLKGSVQGDRLAVTIDSKARTYRIETSAYVGPLTTRTSVSESSTSPSPQEPSIEPSVKLAVEKSDKSTSSSGGQVDQSNSQPTTAKVMVTSEPSGADIYVDGAFMGNTPSQLQLGAGSHTVRIEASGKKPWSRAITLTAGGKVTIQAVLETP
jgi:hypothetical protein